MAATTGPGEPPTSRLEPPREPLAGPSPAPVPPIPPERLLAALRRARAALVTRQAQLAACRTCGTEAAAYQQAAADLAALAGWLGLEP